jgi:hypothetical protein
MNGNQALEHQTQVVLQNARAALALDLNGGAITDFHLLENEINPLSFKFTREQMPENNRGGAPYQGHFLCLGRWGEPSAGELAAGMPHHGQFANSLWQLKQSDTDGFVHLTATAPLEGLQLSRTLQLDPEGAAFAVEEQVTNTNPLGRMYNMVQHPTLTSPFLSQTTQVDCNAAAGFNQHFSSNPMAHALAWPMGYAADAYVDNLRTPARACNAVYSFIVDKSSSLGWITAYSPIHQTVIGYVWKREDYPWINLWQHWAGNQIRYRGIEFGTAGIHKPFKEIITTAPRVFGESTFSYIDAGETISRRYVSFLFKVEASYAGAGRIEIRAGKIHILGKQQHQHVCIATRFKNFL